MAIENKNPRFIHGQAYRCDPPDETCPRCGQDGLELVNIGMGRWILYDGMRRHECHDAESKAVAA